MATISPNPWFVREDDFPRSASVSQQIRFLLNYAILAPSAHNSQPWRFEVSANMVSLYADLTRELPAADPEHRELFISCGTALFNLRLAAAHFGYSTELERLPNRAQPDLIARVHLREVSNPATLTRSEEDDDLLFSAISQRHTHRGDFAASQPPDLILSQMQRDVRLEGAYLRVVRPGAEHTKLGNLIFGATRALGRRAHYCEELASWLRFNVTRKHDGMPGYSHGFGGVASVVFPSLVRNLLVGDAMAQSHRRLAMAAPRLVALWTEHDEHEDWIDAGQALGRLLLRGAANGLQASFFSTPLQVHPYRGLTAAALDLLGYPQMIARLGYGPPAKETPRRPSDEVTYMSRR